MSLFKRKIQVIINDKMWTFPELEIGFNVKFGSDGIPAEASCEIMNLNDDSISNIKAGQKIIINAGYENDLGTILDGVVVNSSLTGERTDRKLKINALNVTDQYLNIPINATFSGPATSEYLIKSVLSLVGIVPNVLSLGRNLSYQFGFNANGKMLNVLRRLTDEAWSKLVIRNSSIIIMPDMKGTETGFLSNASTGLITIDPIENDNTPAKYKVKMLLNHAITAYSILEIQSKTFNGLALVIEGNHYGGSGDFTTECDIMPL
jgi:hypothetical protein